MIYLSPADCCRARACSRMKFPRRRILDDNNAIASIYSDAQCYCEHRIALPTCPYLFLSKSGACVYGLKFFALSTIFESRRSGRRGNGLLGDKRVSGFHETMPSFSSINQSICTPRHASVDRDVGSIDRVVGGVNIFSPSAPPLLWDCLLRRHIRSFTYGLFFHHSFVRLG